MFGIEQLNRDAVLALGQAMHYGSKLILRDGTKIHRGAPVSELQLDRSRVARLHRTTTRHRLGLALRRELERTLKRLAQIMMEDARYPHWRRFGARRCSGGKRHA